MWPSQSSQFLPGADSAIASAADWITANSAGPSSEIACRILAPESYSRTIEGGGEEPRMNSSAAPSHFHPLQSLEQHFPRGHQSGVTVERSVSKRSSNGNALFLTQCFWKARRPILTTGLHHHHLQRLITHPEIDSG